MAAYVPPTKDEDDPSVKRLFKHDRTAGDVQAEATARRRGTQTAEQKHQAVLDKAKGVSSPRKPGEGISEYMARQKRERESATAAGQRKALQEMK